MSKRTAASKAELEIVRIVWDLNGATVRQVLESLPEDRRLDYKTVQTYLRRLEAKGYLQSRREGRSSLFKPRMRPAQVIRETVADLVDRLFGGDAMPLVEHLITDGKLSSAKIKKLRKLIDDSEASHAPRQP